MNGECRALRAGRQVAIIPPPVESNFLSFIKGTYEQADPDCQQLDFSEGHLDVPGDDQPLVQNPVENVDEARGAVRRVVQSHAAGDYIVGP